MIIEDLPTPTQLLLLQQQVDGFESYLNWVIGGVTLTITILIALFLGIQFFSIRSLINKDLEKIEENTEKGIKKQEDKLEKISKELQNQIYLSRSEIGKSISYTATQKGNWETAFIWKVEEAYWYYIGRFNNYTTFVPMLLSYAKKSLERIEDGKLNLDIVQIKLARNSLNTLYKIEEKEVSNILELLDTKIH